MNRKHPVGICRICGKYQKLSFEHVPLRATYNKSSIRFVNIKDWIEGEGKDSLPWELDKAKGTISQRGRGGYYICESCNNNTGAWYGKYYKRFVDCIMYAQMSQKSQDSEGLVLELKQIRPLAVYKQIVAMFCDINEHLYEYDGIRDFLLDKYNNDFDSNKYRLFMYMQKSGVERTIPICARIELGQSKPIMVSEISSIPVGFLLYIDLPETYSPKATEITPFVKCDYEQETTVVLPLNIYENNSWIPADFRSKEEIIATIEKSKKVKESD